ncbi:MAG TPA: hypothetical protein VNJ52_05075 [Patescibacteria group bacterium]|nr:hypothetical protein [Patescibacteria group bacterium]
MICQTHTDSKTGRVWITYHPEKWHEWIIFRCPLDYVREFRKRPFGWVYVHLKYWNPWTLDSWMVLAPVALFLVAGRRIKNAWFYPAVVLYRHGWLGKLKQGQPVHWFWFRYVARKQNP